MVQVRGCVSAAIQFDFSTRKRWNFLVFSKQLVGGHGHGSGYFWRSSVLPVPRYWALPFLLFLAPSYRVGSVTSGFYGDGILAVGFHWEKKFTEVGQQNPAETRPFWGCCFVAGDVVKQLELLA